MKKRKLSKTVVLLGIMVVAVAALPSPAAAQNVWVFDQMNTNLKPCFRASNASPWVDFGNIGAQGQFEWTDFLNLAKNFLGVPSTATEATIRFTWVPSGPGATCPAQDADVSSKTVFEVGGPANVYIFVGGREEVRRLSARNDRDDHDD